MRGAPADMDAVAQLAERFGLRVIEDVAQAIGGGWRGRRLGTIGDLGCFSLQFNKIITCGEGGVVVTDDAVLHERALMYQDVAASQRQPLREAPLHFGLVARMSELQGAVADTQLRRLDAIIDDCRDNRAKISEATADDLARKGVHPRSCHDAAGDTGIAFVLMCPDASIARSLDGVLRAEGLPSRLLYDPDRVDFHIVNHWRPILDHRSWSTHTPWDHLGVSAAGHRTEWPRSSDLLGRAVHLDVSPDLTDRQIERMASAIRSAAQGL
jgi:8-amino-3,8-dideoxy-alpha-D-manno-octulosonate transaminase